MGAQCVVRTQGTLTLFIPKTLCDRARYVVTRVMIPFSFRGAKFTFQDLDIKFSAEILEWLLVGRLVLAQIGVSRVSVSSFHG